MTLRMFSTKSSASIVVSWSRKPRCCGELRARSGSRRSARRRRTCPVNAWKSPPTARAASAAAMLESRPPREVRADRDVGAQVEVDRLVDERRAAARRTTARCGRSRARSRPPSSARSRTTPLRTVSVWPGQELVHALEERLAGEAELEGEVVLERVEVGLDRGQEGQQRLRLGGADRTRRRRRRSRSGLIPKRSRAQKSSALRLVPDREGEHAAQALDARRRPSCR